MALTLAKTYLAAPIPAPFLHQMRPRNDKQNHQALAMQQLLTVPAEVKEMSMTRMAVEGASGLHNKIVAFRQAVFPSPTKMALRYGIEPGSKSALWLYAYRWRSLARQAWARFKRDDKTETAVSPILKRKRQLTEWLHTPD